MASGGIQEHTRDLSESSENTSLLDLVSNSLILRQTTPYLPISALLNLAATSKSFQATLRHNPDAFRHADLTTIKAAQFQIESIDRGGEIWRNVQVDENVTEDDFYSGPLRGVFSNLGRTGILRNVQTLVLDGLSVTAELVNEILVDFTRFQVRILSIREAKNLNERRLMQTLRYACRSGRPEGTPRLRGLYVFGKKDQPVLPPAAPAATTAASPASSAASSRAGSVVSVNWHDSRRNSRTSNTSDQPPPRPAKRAVGDDWYHKKGRIISRPIADGWAETVLDCGEAGVLFDSVLCTGPRHQNSSAFGKVPVSGVPSGHHPYSVATFALSGCATCGCAPEGFTVYSESPQLPLLSPISKQSSNVRAATRPQVIESDDKDSENASDASQFVPRCWDCIRERYCFSCDQWWCESCYQVPTHVHHVNNAHGHPAHTAASEQHKAKVRMGHCRACNPRSLGSVDGE
ncbi:hypothetical protein BX600DRAFT_112931 [Xylariales sp. PMI_506]|nr:hypothetical protein BX600DRAFT_112931 [Xylariales sp. PMI_506]